MKTNRIISAIILSAIILGQIGLGAGTAYACSCVARENIEAAVREDFERVSAVFLGKALAVEQADFMGEIEFEVSEVWKGEVGKNFKIKGSGSSASCGWNPEVGKEYIVYAGFYEGEYSTSLCDPNHEPPLTENERAIFGSSTEPVQESGGWWKGFLGAIGGFFSSIFFFL